MKSIEELSKEIDELSERLNTERLSGEDKQIILDTIAEDKRLIEKLSKAEQKIMPVIGAPIVADRNVRPQSIFHGNKVSL